MADPVNKTNLLLYKLDGSPPASAVMMLGDMLGIKFTFKEPDLFNKEHKTPEFRKINPMGTIPTLKDGDFIVSESHAIMKYLLEVYGGDMKETLYPSDPKTRAIIDQAMFFNAGVLFVRLKEILIPTFFGGAKRPNAEQRAGVEDAYFVLESYLQNTPYIAGDHITLADICLASTMATSLAVHELNGDKFPRATNWLHKMREESVFKKINAPGVAKFTHVLNLFWDRNENK